MIYSKLIDNYFYPISIDEAKPKFTRKESPEKIINTLTNNINIDNCKRNTSDIPKEIICFSTKEIISQNKSEYNKLSDKIFGGESDYKTPLKDL